MMTDDINILRKEKIFGLAFLETTQEYWFCVEDQQKHLQNLLKVLVRNYEITPHIRLLMT